MIIPIKVPKGRGEEDGSSSMEKIEWVMLELNGELVKPQHEAVRKTTTETEQNELDKRRVEFGSIQFDDSVSKLVHAALLSNHCICYTQISHHMRMNYLGCTYPNNWKPRTQGNINHFKEPIRSTT